MVPKMKPSLPRFSRKLRIALTFLNNVGLNYLTLSGARQPRVGSAYLLGQTQMGPTFRCPYILDEPSIGLPPEKDTTGLIASLKKMRLGAILIVVEHDEDTHAKRRMTLVRVLVFFGGGDCCCGNA